MLSPEMPANRGVRIRWDSTIPVCVLPTIRPLEFTISKYQAITEGRPVQPSNESRYLGCRFDRLNAIADDLDPGGNGGGSCQLQATLEIPVFDSKD